MTPKAALSHQQAVTPYLFVEGVDRLIDFCTEAFDAALIGRLTRPEGTVMHAEIKIGDSVIMMGEPMGELDAAPGWLFVRVADCDATYARAIGAGGESIMEVTDMYHAGERYGGVRDPLGNVWWIATAVEDVPWEEQQRRVDAMVEQELGR